MPEKKVAAREVERDSYTAKQIATKLGTDAKTMRKFFRSDASTTEAVGRGGRYEFDAEQLPEIRQEFTAWVNGEKLKRPEHGIIEEEDNEDIEEEDDEED